MVSRSDTASNGRNIDLNAAPDVVRSVTSDSHGLPSSNIMVCARIRPFNEREEQNGERDAGPCVHFMSETQVMLEGIASEHSHETKCKEFCFDRVYDSTNAQSAEYASQELIMNEVGVELQRCVVKGFNACLFAYGQTGSGKTFTMLGTETSPGLRGLLPRIIDDCFSEMEEEKARVPSTSFACGVQYIEIYNERIRDLLLLDSHESRQKLLVRHSPKFGVYIQGLRDIPVFASEEVHKHLAVGMKSRTVAATCMNDQSSRSHCIFTLEVQSSSPLEGGGERQLRARLHLVDLAGSERQSKAQTAGQRLKEGAMINKSLTTLAMVIHKLAEICDMKVKRKSTAGVLPHVPFRDSKLTAVLEDSISGNSKTIMMAAVSPAESNLEETASTLRFAERAKSVRTKSMRNEESRQDIVAALRAECEQLRSHLASLEGASTQAPVLNGEVTGLEALIRHYGEDAEARLLVAQEHECRCTQALEHNGLLLTEMSTSLGLGESTPQLVNISHDPSLQGCLVFFLRKGERAISIGSAEGSEIRFRGLGMEDRMAYIQNADDLNVSIRVVDGRVLVNGRQASTSEGTAQRLHNGDRVIFGFSSCFGVAIPLAIENDETGQERHDLEQALDEINVEHHAVFEGCSSFIEELQCGLGVARAQSFLRRFKKLVNLVEEANQITREVRPHVHMQFQVEVAVDLGRRQTDEPELLVRLRKRERGSKLFKSAAIAVCQGLSAIASSVCVYDGDAFGVRMEFLRQAYEDFRHGGPSVDLPQHDPWHDVSSWQLEILLGEARLQEARLAQDDAPMELGGMSPQNARVRLLENTVTSARSRSSTVGNLAGRHGSHVGSRVFSHAGSHHSSVGMSSLVAARPSTTMLDSTSPAAKAATEVAADAPPNASLPCHNHENGASQHLRDLDSKTIHSEEWMKGALLLWNQDMRELKEVQDAKLTVLQKVQSLQEVVHAQAAQIKDLQKSLRAAEAEKGSLLASRQTNDYSQKIGVAPGNLQQIAPRLPQRSQSCELPHVALRTFSPTRIRVNPFCVRCPSTDALERIALGSPQSRQVRTPAEFQTRGASSSLLTSLLATPRSSRSGTRSHDLLPHDRSAVLTSPLTVRSVDAPSGRSFGLQHAMVRSPQQLLPQPHVESAKGGISGSKAFAIPFGLQTPPFARSSSIGSTTGQASVIWPARLWT